MTKTDLTADEIVWDLAPLLPAPGDAGIEQLLGAADAQADELAAFRGRIAELDAGGLGEFLRGLAEGHHPPRRAGSVAGRAVPAGPPGPPRGARQARGHPSSPGT